MEGALWGVDELARFPQRPQLEEHFYSGNTKICAVHDIMHINQTTQVSHFKKYRCTGNANRMGQWNLGQTWSRCPVWPFRPSPTIFVGSIARDLEVGCGARGFHLFCKTESYPFGCWLFGEFVRHGRKRHCQESAPQRPQNRQTLAAQPWRGLWDTRRSEIQVHLRMK